MNFKNSEEFTRKYTVITLQRGRIFKEVTLFVSIYSLGLDLILYQDHTIDLRYRQTLIALHLTALVLSLAYILAYILIKRSRRLRHSRAAKAVIVSDLFLTLLFGALLTLNAQRFSGNIDAYLLLVIVVAPVIPLYPKWVLGIYGFVHLAFLIALRTLFDDNTIAIKLFNTTTAVLAAAVLFIILYRSNVKSFLSEEIQKEAKETFVKLFEINPFPLMIVRFDDGKLRYVNQSAAAFYEIPKAGSEGLYHRDFYTNESDLTFIYRMLAGGGALRNYVVEQKTVSGQIRRSIVSYERIDYLGEKCLLIGVADLAEIRRMEHELAINASVDVQTGVLNRRVGMELVQKRLEAAKAGAGGFCLCFMDIDNLKAVNDRFGHLEGDRLIADVCRVIREEIRRGDVVFRFGGDEFVVLFGDGDEAGSASACRRISARFEALNREQYKPYALSVSMGRLCYTPEMNLDIEQLIEIVDKDMYCNKLEKKQA